MRSHVLWISCVILAGFALASHAYINDADEENAYRKQHRNRLLAAWTAYINRPVRLPQMAEMSATTSRSSELIRQFIPSGRPSTRSPVGGPVVCPDHESFCPEETTCCPMADDESFGCCPAPEAVCCADHIHCCPNGMTCDTEQETCKAKDDSSATSRLLRKIPSTRTRPGANIACPDNKSTCPDGMTCCQVESGDYECCPEPDAVCCSDHVHCCPNGTTCDLQELTCNGDDSVKSRLLRKIPSKRLPLGDDIVCPDNQSSCVEGTTCCKSEDGSYGCCPSPDAVCCSDHIHCCPNGMQCDVEEQRCLDESAIVQILRKLPAKRIIRKTGVPTTSAHHNCAGSQADRRSSFSCPSGSSCCVNEMLDSASCCPHANGECCSNGECCPLGFKCTDSGECITTSHIITATPKPLFEATKEKSNAYGTVVTICGDNSECPGRSTCCPVINTFDGTVQSYRCCGLSRASCCGVDADFCCPQGYKCAYGRHCERLAPAAIFMN